jgi:hypothetical protein
MVFEFVVTDYASETDCQTVGAGIRPGIIPVYGGRVRAKPFGQGGEYGGTRPRYTGTISCASGNAILTGPCCEGTE